MPVAALKGPVPPVMLWVAVSIETLGSLVKQKVSEVVERSMVSLPVLPFCAVNAQFTDWMRQFVTGSLRAQTSPPHVHLDAKPSKVGFRVVCTELVACSCLFPSASCLCSATSDAASE